MTVAYADTPIAEWKRKELRAHRRKVFCVGWNEDGRRLATGSHDETMRVWSCDEAGIFKQEMEMRGHQDAVSRLAWHPTHPDKLASLGQLTEQSVRFWDTRSGKNTATLPTPGINLSLVWSPDAQYMAVNNLDDVVSILDVRRMKVVSKHNFKQQASMKSLGIECIFEIAFSKDSKHFYLATDAGEVEVLSFPDFKPERTMKGHVSRVSCMGFDPGHTRMASGGMDTVTSLWDLEEGICTQTFYDLDQAIRGVGFSHDGQYLAIVSEEPALEVVNLRTGANLGKQVLRTCPVDVAWNPRRHILAFPGASERDGSGAEHGLVELRYLPEQGQS
ncbi:THO complex subunit 3 [Auxenochlorella protothecoides]|uniref:THO complex subunit 3 n=1 Tax=Auxenochlorella protothecoides TaxID=3075 RepID=A0A087STC7_AUXPR|nr:THO complex subunit 3 [Auxenochlorella protothecoides]KFM28981.1 THO complex subunit 3 [Auxenochlorella protothecoides]